jgi:hypothetical protein
MECGTGLLPRSWRTPVEVLEREKRMIEGPADDDAMNVNDEN